MIVVAIDYGQYYQCWEHLAPLSNITNMSHTGQCGPAPGYLQYLLTLDMRLISLWND